MARHPRKKSSRSRPKGEDSAAQSSSAERKERKNRLEKGRAKHGERARLVDEATSRQAASNKPPKQGKPSSKSQTQDKPMGKSKAKPAEKSKAKASTFEAEGAPEEVAVQKLLSRKDYTPMVQEELIRRLSIAKGEQGAFRQLLEKMEKRGQIVRVKDQRYVLPRDADLVIGTIRFRQSGRAILIPDDAPPGKAETYTIRAEDTWVAMHMDKVVARVERGRPRYRQQRANRPERDERKERMARVIRILERARTNLAGTLQKSRLYWFVVPDDPRIIQDILVPPPERTNLEPKPRENDKVVVKLLEWKQRHLNPQGEIIEVLGKTHTPSAEYKALLRLYRLEPEFPPEVMADVADIPREVRQQDWGKRMDFTDRHVFTIDPDDAKDFDDALSLERLEDDGVRIGVHIADVSAYVRPGTPLDKEGQKRGNSTYLVGSVIPMLPHALSNGLCSLVEGQNRLTKSVFLTFTAKGRLTETSFANTVICSRKRLTYRQAYAFLKEDDLEKVAATPLPPAHQTGSTGRSLMDLSLRELQDLQADIRGLWEIASRLRQRRMQRGSLDLDMPEVKIFVDEEGHAERMELISHDESHQLIEEFMLAANEAVARALRQANVPALYRVHDDPEDDRLDELRETLAAMNVAVGDLTKRSEITKLLQAIREHPQAHLLRIEFLRALKQACYRADPDGHYGLHKKDYTHFTSPIRRYSDLIIHRIFDACLQKQGNATAPEEVTPYPYRRLDDLARHLSITEQNSTEAERESEKVKRLEFFERELTSPQPQTFDAIIVEIKNHGLFVELSESLAYGLIHVSTLRDDLYSLTMDGTALVGRKRKRRLGLGETIQVQVHRVDRFKRQVDFKLAK